MGIMVRAARPVPAVGSCGGTDGERLRQGNKGATGARMLFTPKPSKPAEGGYEGKPFAFTFVNAHLAAFDEMFDKRNADYHDLSHRLFFDSAVVLDDGPPTGSWYTPAPVPLTIYETDVLFWLVSTRCSVPRAIRS